MKRLILPMLLLPLAQAAVAAEYRWLNGWDRNHYAVPNITEPYIKAVEKASNGRIKFSVHGPETVPPFEQLQPVASGAFQFLMTHGSYHFGTTPLLTAIEAIGGTPAQRYASGLIEWVDQQYQKIGLKLIALPMTPDGCYHIILRQPLTANGDLQGRKIRATPSYGGVLKQLGASSVLLPPAEIYTALEKGVVDGAGWPVLGTVNYRWHEVAKHMLRPGFGFGTNPILVHLPTWNKFPEADKKIMLDEARKLEQSWLKDGIRLTAEEEKALAEKGMQTIRLSDAQYKKLQQAWTDSIWEVAAQKAKKEVEELRAMAKARGL